MSRPLPILHRSLLAASLLLLAGAASAATYTQVNIGGGGFVTGIIFSPKTQNVVFARTDVAGMFRWNNAASTWVPTIQSLEHDNWPQGWTESVAADPTNSSIVYQAGGYETNPANGNNANKSALMRSADGGVTWTTYATPFVMNGNGEGRSNGERLAVDPNKNTILFMGSRAQGLWKSTNSGATWTQVTSFPVTSTANGVGVNNVIFQKNTGTSGNATQTIFASVSRAGSSNLYKSTNGGTSWTAVSGQPTTWMPHHIALDASNVLYITYGKGDNNDGAGPSGLKTGAVYKLSGSTWTNITPVVPQALNADYFGYAGLGVSPTTGTVFVSTMDRWNYGNTIFRTTNSGGAWSDLKAGAHTAPNNAWTTKTGEAGWGGWIGDVRVDPFNAAHVIYGDGGGIWESTNATATTPAWTFKSKGVEETGVWGYGVGIVSPPNSTGRLFSALGDVDGFRHIDTTVSPVAGNHSPSKGSNTSIDVAWNAPWVVTRTYFSGNRGAISWDNGVTFYEFGACPAEATANDPGAVRVSPGGDKLVWSPMNSQIYYSSNSGGAWTKSTGGPVPANTWDQFTATWDLVNNSKVYTYNRNDGKVYRSTNSGATFAQVATINAWGVSPLRPVPGYEGNLWMGLYDGIYRSTDSGSTWAKVTTTFSACEHVGFGRSSTGSGHPAVYAYAKSASDSKWGFWVSENQGSSWTKVTDDAHRLGMIRDLVGDPQVYGRFYVASNGIMQIDK